MVITGLIGLSEACLSALALGFTGVAITVVGFMAAVATTDEDIMVAAITDEAADTTAAVADLIAAL
jgi:hypothetical protein